MPDAAFAGTPIALFRSFAGNTDYAGTAASFRSEPDSGDACALSPTATANLSGIPATGTPRVAYLYWAGSGSVPDNTVTFQGNVVNADRSFTEIFSLGSNDYDFFSGAADVTSLVTGNGVYTMTDLAVDSGAPFCSAEMVLAGWALLVVYDDPAEPLRVINLFDGFQFFRSSSLTLTPDNFSYLPCAAPSCAKLAHITWEGDDSQGDALRFEGRRLSDADNPANNQFNSTVNVANPTTNEWGVDFDAYDVTGDLTLGQTSATSDYNATGDLVLLSAQVFGVTNLPVADLAINKSHSGDFYTGSGEEYVLRVDNLGPSDEPGLIVVDDPLPAGLNFASAAGAGWSCSESGGVVQCSHAGPLGAGGTLPQLRIQVVPDAGALPAVTNTASVSGTRFDNVAANDSSSDPTTVIAADVVVVKSLAVIDDPVRGAANPIAIPGATVEYRIVVTHAAGAPAPANNVAVSDDLGPQVLAGNFAFLPNAYGVIPGHGIEVTAPNINGGVPTPLSNAADADPGAVLGDVVTVGGIQLNPGESATVRFRVVIQ